MRPYIDLVVSFLYATLTWKSKGKTRSSLWRRSVYIPQIQITSSINFHGSFDSDVQKKKIYPVRLHCFMILQDRNIIYTVLSIYL